MSATTSTSSAPPTKLKPKKPFEHYSKNFVWFVVQLVLGSKTAPFQLVKTRTYSLFLLKPCGPIQRYWFKLVSLQILLLALVLKIGLSKRIDQGLLQGQAILFGTHVVKLIITICVVLCQSTSWFHKDEMCLVFNTGVRLQDWLLGRGLKCPMFYASPIAMFPVLAVFSGTFALPFGLGFMAFMYPRDLGALAGILGLYFPVTPLIATFMALWETYLVFTGYLYFSFQMFDFWAYYVNVLNWFHMFQTVKHKDPSTQLKCLESMHQAYRSIICFTTVFNVLNLELLSIMVFVLCGIETYCFFTLLTQIDALPLQLTAAFGFVAFMILFVIIVVMNQLGQIRAYSKSIQRSWSHQISELEARNLQEENDQVRALLHSRIQQLKAVNRSLKPFGIRVLRIYFTIKTPARMVEGIFSFLLIMLH